MKPHAPTFLAVLALASAHVASATDWSHISGPNSNRTTAEKGPSGLGAGQLKKVWEIETGGGFSSFVTGGGRAYTVALKGGRETLVTVDRKDGKQLWEATLARAEYQGGGDRGARGNDGGDGPRITPVFAAGRLFVLDGDFVVHAFDAASGKSLWRHDLLKEFGGRQITWNNAAAPVVWKDNVIVSGGGADQSTIAFKADTGAVVWKAGSDRPTHSTPIITTIHGKEQVLIMVERGLISRDPANGQELWNYPFQYRTSTAASPVVWQDIVNVAAAYGVGGGACKVSLKDGKWSTEEIWRSPGNTDTASHWSTAVVVDGYLYGCYGHVAPGQNPFKCVDIRTGKTMWQQAGFGPSQVILANGKLLATTDAGVLKIIEPTPTAYKEVASEKIVDGKVWATLILSDGQLLVRSTKQGVCYQL